MCALSVSLSLGVSRSQKLTRSLLKPRNCFKLFNVSRSQNLKNLLMPKLARSFSRLLMLSYVRTGNLDALQIVSESLVLSRILLRSLRLAQSRSLFQVVSYLLSHSIILNSAMAQGLAQGISTLLNSSTIFHLGNSGSPHVSKLVQAFW